VRLRSALPTAKPRIVHNYLSDEHDPITLRAGLRLALDIGRQPSIRRHLKNVDAAATGLLPASENDADLESFARHRAFSCYHPVGTCAMGQAVDPDSRVIGVDRLRVADTSVMPTLIGGNTNAAAIMIGEKAADLIKSDRTH
jgi:choline dehydrogenase